jgi:hypothetical protein
VRSDLFMVKAKSMFAVGVAMVSIFAYLNSVYDGRVVARLPFEPVFPIRSLSHRNLLGSDYTECAFIFICIVTLTHTHRRQPASWRRSRSVPFVSRGAHEA